MAQLYKKTMTIFTRMVEFKKRIELYLECVWYGGSCCDLKKVIL